MDELVLSFPPREEGLALHLDLCDLNPTAVADVCRAYLAPLLAWLAAKYPRVDPDLCRMATHDALMAYVRKPQSYNPTRMDLGSYLRMASQGDLLNQIKRESKHQKGRVAMAVVEDLGEDRNLSGKAQQSLQLDLVEEAEQWRATLEPTINGFADEERQVLELMMAGERKTSVYAKTLGLEALPVAEQDREVKKVKDRIKKRLERGVSRHA
jgi:hypothetical protein